MTSTNTSSAQSKNVVRDQINGSMPKNEDVTQMQQTIHNSDMKSTEQRSAPTATLAGTFAVRKGIPMPASRNSGGGVAKYPWATMEPGDMFFVPGAKIETFYTLTSTAKKKYGKAFKAVKLTEEGVDGVGVWCLEGAA